VKTLSSKADAGSTSRKLLENLNHTSASPSLTERSSGNYRRAGVQFTHSSPDSRWAGRVTNDFLYVKHVSVVV